MVSRNIYLGPQLCSKFVGLESCPVPEALQKLLAAVETGSFGPEASTAVVEWWQQLTADELTMPAAAAAGAKATLAAAAAVGASTATAASASTSGGEQVDPVVTYLSSLLSEAVTRQRQATMISCLIHLASPEGFRQLLRTVLRPKLEARIRWLAEDSLVDKTSKGQAMLLTLAAAERWIGEKATWDVLLAECRELPTLLLGMVEQGMCGEGVQPEQQKQRRQTIQQQEKQALWLEGLAERGEELLARLRDAGGLCEIMQGLMGEVLELVGAMAQLEHQGDWERAYNEEVLEGLGGVSKPVQELVALLLQVSTCLRSGRAVLAFAK